MQLAVEHEGRAMHNHFKTLQHDNKHDHTIKRVSTVRAANATITMLAGSAVPRSADPAAAARGLFKF